MEGRTTAMGSGRRERLRKEKMRREGGRASSELHLEWTCLRVPCNPEPTPPWESILAALTRGPKWTRVWCTEGNRDLLSLSAKTRILQTQISTNRI
jgi:hypothetical protein